MRKKIYQPTVNRAKHIGRGTQIGAFCDIGKDVTIGENCNIQCHVTIANGTVIGNNVFIAPNVSILNDKYMTWNITPAKIGDNVKIGACSVIMPNVRVGPYALVGAGSVITRDVKPRQVVFGNPARIIREVSEKEMK